MFNLCFFLSLVAAQDITHIIDNLKNASFNIDTIPPRILKQIKEIVAAPIAEIINKSLMHGIFPDSLKVAKIIPIYKSGDTQKVQNYRPIAILPTISKMFEKCVAIKLNELFTKFNILSPHQYEFLKGKSTSDAFQQLTEYIYDSLNKNIIVWGY